MYPTNTELRAMLKVPKKNKKGGGKHESGKASVEKFFIPKNLDIEVVCQENRFVLYLAVPFLM